MYAMERYRNAWVADRSVSIPITKGGTWGCETRCRSEESFYRGDHHRSWSKIL